MSAAASGAAPLRILVPGSESETQRSGSPYFLRGGIQSLAAAQGLTVASSPLPRVRSFPVSAAWWCLRNRTTLSRAFLLSQPFIDAAARSDWGRDLGRSDAVIMFGQVTPRRLQRAGLPVVQVTDLSLREYLSLYPELDGLGPGARARLFAAEKASYAASTLVACYTEEAKADLVGQYGLDPGKILVCGRGVNWRGPLDYRPPALAADAPVDIGLIGTDVLRKGIRELAAGIDLYMARTGRAVRLHVMGASGADGFERPYIQWWGRVDKDAERARFTDFMAQVHIGALLSEAEGIPGSVYEFLYFGRPVIVSAESRVSPSVVADNGTILSDRADPQAVADAIDREVRRLQAGRYPQPEGSALTWTGVAERIVTGLKDKIAAGASVGAAAA